MARLVELFFGTRPVDVLLAKGQADIIRRLVTLDRKLEDLMATAKEMQAALVEANTTTNEIADDVTALLAKVAAGGMSPAESDAVQAQIVALGARLKDVAAAYTPETPAPAPTP